VTIIGRLLHLLRRKRVYLTTRFYDESGRLVAQDPVIYRSRHAIGQSIIEQYETWIVVDQKPRDELGDVVIIRRAKP
jgi:hypothetical protein